MAFANMLAEHASEIAVLAAECGIDWYQISDLSHGIHKNLPAISPKYKGKSLMWVEEKTSRSGQPFIRITFHTKKHGGISRTWHSHLARSDAMLLPLRNTENKEEERLRRRALFTAYRDGYRDAPKAKVFPYLEKKGIAEIVGQFDIRLMTDAKILGRGPAKPFICFALYSPNGSYVGLQRIYTDGQKKLTTGLGDGQYRGAHAIIGNPEESEVIYVVEGFATAASVHLATGMATVFAYSASNLDPVVAHLTSRYEDKRIVIAADNDQTKDGNTGLFKAWEAARKNSHRGRPIAVAVPPLLNEAKTDFNDVYRTLGKDKLLGFLENPQTPARNHIEYLMELLSWARAPEIPALIRQIAVVARVPFFITERALIERIQLESQNRVDHSIVRKNVQAVVVASHYKAKKIAGISDRSVDKKLRFVTTKNQEGHSILSEETVKVVLEELSAGNLVILKAPMAVGKTERAIRVAMNSVTRAAHILPRVSVVNDAANRLKLDHYREIDGVQALFTEKMVTCVNSIGAKRFCAGGRSWFENLDLLCLDEASQVLAQITQLGQAIRKKDNHTVMVNAIRTARSVLVTDADANEFMVQELRRIDPERRVVLIEVEHAVDAKKTWDITFTDSMDQARKDFMDAVFAGQKCLVATDNRRRAMELERLIMELRPCTKILNIHREPTREGLIRMQAFYKDPSVEVEKYDVLIYSPAITSGLSLTKSHFTRHYGMFSGIVKVNDILQMMGRDRASCRWLLCISPTNRHLLTAEVDIRSLGEEPTLFSDLKFATDRYEVESRENLIVLALNILKMKGHRITMAPELERKLDKKLSGLLKKVKDDITGERLARIMSQADISEVEYLQLRNLWMPTDEEAAAITAYRIKNHLCADLSEEVINFYSTGGLNKVALFETLLADDYDIRRFDENEKLTLDPSLRFHASDKKEILNKTFQILGLTDQRLKGEFTHVDCQKVVDLFIANAQKVNILFDGIIDPARPPRCATSFVQRIFARLGLRLGARKSAGRMIRYVEPSDIEVMLMHRERRQQRGRSFIGPNLEHTSIAA